MKEKYYCMSDINPCAPNLAYEKKCRGCLFLQKNKPVEEAVGECINSTKNYYEWFENAKKLEKEREERREKESKAKLERELAIKGEYEEKERQGALYFTLSQPAKRKDPPVNPSESSNFDYIKYVKERWNVDILVWGSSRKVYSSNPNTMEDYFLATFTDYITTIVGEDEFVLSSVENKQDKRRFKILSKTEDRLVLEESLEKRIEKSSDEIITAVVEESLKEDEVRKAAKQLKKFRGADPLLLRKKKEKAEESNQVNWKKMRRDIRKNKQKTLTDSSVLEHYQ